MRPAVWLFVLFGIAALAVLLSWERAAPMRGGSERTGGFAPAHEPEAAASTPAAVPADPLRGRVVADEAGVAGARVWAVADGRLSARAMVVSGPPVAETTADAEGDFSLNVPADRAHFVYARAADHAPGSVFVPTAERVCTVTLPANARRRAFRVVDIEEQPVADATVQVFHEDREEVPVEAVATEADGGFSVTLFDDAMLVVTASGFAVRRVEADRESDTVVLTVGAPIAGVVVDGEGAPLSGLLVALDRPFQAADVQRTGADGRFRFEGVELETQTVGVFRDDDQVAVDSIEPGDENVRFVIAAPGTSTGFVVFEDGRPAAGATVSGQKTDAAGRFTYRVARFGRTVYARLGVLPALPGEDAPPEWVGWAPDDITQPIRIVLRRQARSFLRVRFVDGANRPVKGVALGSLPCQVSDEEGRAVTGYVLPPGSTVRPQPRAGRSPMRFEATTHAVLATAPELLVHVPEPARATLVVRLPNGAPLPQETKAGITLGFAHIVERGHDRALFEFDRLSAYRRIHIELTTPGFIRTFAALPFPDENATVEVNLSRGIEVVGRLLDEGGAPLRGWAHVWVPGGGAVGAEFAADGRFRFAGVAPGAGQFQFGRRPDEPTLALDRSVDGERVDLGDIRIAPPRMLRGRVTGDGPLAGVRVTFAHNRHEVVTATRPDGTFRLRVLPGLEAQLQVSKPGWGATVVDAVPDQQVVLQRPGKVRLIAERADPPDPRVIAYSFGVRRPGATTRLPVRTVFRMGRERIFADVPDGPVEVFVETVIGVRAVPVQVVAGETVSVTLTIP